MPPKPAEARTAPAAAPDPGVFDPGGPDAMVIDPGGRAAVAWGLEMAPALNAQAPAQAAGFPFAAIVGQEELKLALTIAAVAPEVGGVLAMGDRGSGKSTAIRALSEVLPVRTDADGQPRSPPVVDLPLGASEDSVVGALDLEQALGHGRRVFQPGLLARADGGFLYVDEVNLLEDHLVDLLLDAAASGVNVVERDGLSIRHSARFVLVGSGNPEEGELRPQLLDRFGLSVEVRAPATVEARVEVLRRRDAHDRDPHAFAARWAGRQAALARRLAVAQSVVGQVAVSRRMLTLAARLCLTLGCDGVRGELTLIRAARAAAALDGRRSVTPAHLARVAPMALRHRLRGAPGDEAGAGARIARAMAEVLGS
jgi:magnesium chelatase subunit I